MMGTPKWLVKLADAIKMDDDWGVPPEPTIKDPYNYLQSDGRNLAPLGGCFIQ